MVTISNSQRDEAVRYLRQLAALSKGETTKEVNLRRLALRLAKKLEKR
jgi:hypothetical protein